MGSITVSTSWKPSARRWSTCKPRLILAGAEVSIRIDFAVALIFDEDQRGDSGSTREVLRPVGHTLSLRRYFGLSRHRMQFLPYRVAAQHCGLLFFLLLAASLSAQAQTSSSELSAAEQQALMAQQARQQATERILAAGGVPLEGAIDPDAYLVGPGDVFSVSTGGALSLQVTTAVTADGVLVIPEVGSFPVAGQTLANARARIGAALQQAYRNVPTEVALAQPRQFYVHTSGTVVRPGRHVMVPIARVEDAVAAAMGGQSPLLVLQERLATPWRYSTLPSLRNIEVERRDGSRLRVDLLRYYATGDVTHNPYLRDGDAIFVPAFSRKHGGVYIETESGKPLLLDYRLGDTLNDVLIVAPVIDALPSGEQIRVLRRLPNGEIVIFDRDQAPRTGMEGPTPPLTLEPLDRIQIIERSQAGYAEALGFVTHPGTYPIVPGVTTLRDLAEAAGGIRPNGLLRAAYLERREDVERESEEDQEASLSAQLQSSEERAMLLELETFENARLSNLPFGSRQYMVREILQFQQVSLDLSETLSVDQLPAVPLRTGDRFVVPRDPNAVLVIGQVRNPGYIPYVPDADVDYYLEQAGGLGPAATDIYVREAGTGLLRTPDDGPLRSGDYIFADRNVIADTESLQALALQEQQLDFQQERERADRRFQYIQTGLAILGTAVSVVTTYLFITRDGS